MLKWVVLMMVILVCARTQEDDADDQTNLEQEVELLLEEADREQEREEGVPEKPAAVTVKKSTATSLLFTVTPPEDDGGMPITGYTVEYENTKLEVAVGEDILVKDLFPGSANYFIFRAKNDVGEGYANYEIVHTKDMSKPSEPSAVTVKESTPTSLLFTVSPPEDTGGMPITGYNVEYSGNVLHVQADEDVYIKNLQPSTEYIFLFRAENWMGLSRPKEVSVTTDNIREPGKPAEIVVKEITPTFIKFTVSPPEDTGGIPIRGYRVEYEGNELDVSEEEVVHAKNLRPSTTYIFQIRAENDIGLSFPKNFTLTTADAREPKEPAAVTVKKPTPTSLLFTVTPPEDNGGMPITEYIAEYWGTVLNVPAGEDILIEDLIADVEYNFEFRVKNDLGESRSIYLDVTTDKPREPYPVKLLSGHVSDDPYTYSIAWEKPQSGGKLIFEYIFKYRKVQVVEDTWTVEKPLSDWITEKQYDDYNAPMRSYVLSNLTQDTYYQLEVICRNVEGYSTPKEEFVFKTGHDTTTNSAPGWTVIQRRVDSCGDFYRPWQDYKDGFGDAQGNMWIGLDKIYELCKQNCELYVNMSKDPTQDSAFAHYTTFSIANEYNKYKLSVGGYSGTAGDSLRFHNGKKFTTYDNDNDTWLSNCAIQYKGAFWYGYCGHANPNGHYFTSPPPHPYANGIVWYAYSTPRVSMKFIEMKVRPTEEV